jgi:hypothetical protein
MRRAKGTDLIPEEGGCHLQEVFVVQQWHGTRETSSAKFDPGKLKIADGIGRSWQEDDPQYKSVTAQGI